MPALYAVSRSLTTENPLFIVVADNNGVEFVASDVSQEKDLKRHVDVVLAGMDKENHPRAALDWLMLGLTGMMMVTTDEPKRAVTMKAAIKVARKMWKEGLTEPSAAAINRMTALSEAHDDWWEDHEDIWSEEDEAAGKRKGDYNVWSADISASPDDELEFQHTVAGAVNPEEPHMWLPSSIDALECAYCDKERADDIHPKGNTMPGNVMVTEEA